MRYMPGVQSEGTERKHHAYTIKRASKAGQCVHLDHWSYRVEAAIKGFTGMPPQGY